MKTIISKDLKSTISPTPGQLLKVAPDGESFEWIDDLSHSHTNKAILDQITSNPVESIVAWTNVTVNRVGNSVTINSSGGGGWTPVNTCWFTMVDYVVWVGDGVNTVFSLASTPAGEVSLFLDWMLYSASEYSIVGSTIAFVNPPNTTETISAIYNVNTTWTPLAFTQEFLWVGDGVNSLFTLPVAPFNSNSVLIFVGRLFARQWVHYTISGNDITFIDIPLLWEPVEALIVTSHWVSIYNTTALSNGPQTFTLPSPAVKMLHVSVDSLTTPNHSASGTNITVTSDIVIGDPITFAYLDNSTCTITGWATENQHLILSGNTLSITEWDGLTVLNSVNLPGWSGGQVFNINIAAATPTVIPHNMNILYPHVTVYLDIPGQYIVCFPDIVMQDANNIIVTHSITMIPTVPLAVRISS